MIKLFHFFILIAIFRISAVSQVLDVKFFACNYDTILAEYKLQDSANTITNPTILYKMGNSALGTKNYPLASIYFHRITEKNEFQNTESFYTAKILLHFRCNEKIELLNLKQSISQQLDADHYLLAVIDLLEISDQYRSKIQIDLDSIVPPLLLRLGDGGLIPGAHLRPTQDLIKFYGSTGEIQKALDASRKLYSQTVQSHPPCSQVLGSVGLTLGRSFLLNDELDSAANYFNASYQIYHDYHAYDINGLGQSLSYIARVAMQKGNAQDAIDILEKGLHTIEKNNTNEPILSHLYNILGINHNRKGNHESAVEFYQKSLNIAEAGPGDSRESKVIAYANIGSIYTKIHEFKKAEYYLLGSLETCLDLFGSEHAYSANIYSMLATLYSNQGDLPKSFSSIKNNYNITKKLYGEDNSRLIEPSRNLAIVCHDLKKYDKALFYIDKARFIAESRLGDQHYRLAQILRNKASFLIDVRNYEEAHSAINEGIGVLDCQDQIADCQDATVYLALLNERIRIQMTELDLPGAMDSLVATCHHSQDVFDHILKTSPSIHTKSEFAAEFEDFHKNVLLAYLLKYEESSDGSYLEYAISVNERIKNLGMMESIKNHMDQIFANIPDHLVDKISALSKTEVGLTQMLADPTLDSLNQKAQWRDSLIAVQKELKRFNLELENNHPQYNRLRKAKFELNTHELQNDLDNRTAILDYTLVDSFLICFIIHKTSVDVIRQQLSHNTLSNELNGVKKYLSSPSSQPIESDEVNALLSTPFNILPKGIRHVIIIPDEYTFGIPFETVLIQDEMALHRFNLSYANSTGIYHLQKHRRQQTNKYPLAAFAPTYRQGIDTLNTNYIAAIVRSGKWHLPNAEKEVVDIAELMNGRSYIDSEATKFNFIKALKENDIVHLSMHAQVNEDDPMMSNFIFDTEGHNPSANLQLYELYTMQSTAQLAVLSACETGLGQYHGGDGVRSLSNGFQYAGIPAVVTSLWKVPDKSTAEIMKSFYYHLKSGVRKSEALRLAKIEYLESNITEKQKHPFYWAGFILVGDTSPLSLSSNNYILLLGGAALLILIFMVTRTRRRQKSL